MHLLQHISILVLYFYSVSAKHVYYFLLVKYICGEPDGVRICHILGINGQFPGPTIEAAKGDILHVTVYNAIQKRSGIPQQATAVHWHGLFQRGTVFEDGAEMVTQCPIPKSNWQTYIFKLEQSGTYWYHSHMNYQYTEGMWGPLVIHNTPAEVYADEYDDELLITLNDWYHTSGQVNTDWLQSPAGAGNRPTPFSFLLNGRGSYPCNSTHLLCDPNKQVPLIFKVNRGKRYRIRVINTSAVTKFFFSIPNHKLVTIEVDGVDTVKVALDRVPIAPAQRYSFIVEMSGNGHEYWILAEADLTMFNFDVPNINPNPNVIIPVVKAKLQYVDPRQNQRVSFVDAKERLESSGPEILWTSHPISKRTNDEFPEQMLLQPYDRVFAPNHFDQNIILNVGGFFDSGGSAHLTFNNITYKMAPEPLLALVLKNKDIPAYVNPFTTGHNKVVQIVVNNRIPGQHPFHLHGHVFWVLGIGETRASDYVAGEDNLILNGVRRDTVTIPPSSWAVFRFVTNNPGVWLFHCHINWHLQLGLAATIIEAPEVVTHNFDIPFQTKRICKSVGIDL